ncbi:hypothetical protein Ping_0247 [Psychromonas ingrahamii 37]|uniref:Uncharacterized protein n=1 Tax=Psychromonas ingrahamii (strain DSM 17664 / CCUG 51855 / 37) TaxID=357804 RepID=A1SRJ9_PSYIN|nr:hypothetical protein Ping_0247 [Psychromonas ingrahamii 37]
MASVFVLLLKSAYVEDIRNPVKKSDTASLAQASLVNSLNNEASKAIPTAEGLVQNTANNYKLNFAYQALNRKHYDVAFSYCFDK